jgi:hypothetical protein
MNDEGMNSVEAPAVPGNMPCPMCGATIAVGSRKCAGCGEILIVSSIPKKWPVRLITVLAALAAGVVLVAFLLPARRIAGPAARRSQCMSNLKMIGIALHNYHERFGSFPPAYTVDADGNRLHSWRTLILPYLDEVPLYNSIDISKPWDDPANAKACETRVPIYYCPADPGLASDAKSGMRNYTTYLAIVGPNSCFRATEPRTISEITDSPSNTLLVVEAPSDRSVPCMSPYDADESLVMSIAENS